MWLGTKGMYHRQDSNLRVLSTDRLKRSLVDLLSTMASCFPNNI